MWLKSWPWTLKTNKVIDKKPNFHYVKMLLSASDWNGINQNKSMSLHTVARSTNESFVTLMALNQREAIKKKVESPNLQAIVEKVHTQMQMHNFFDFGST